MSFWGKPVLFRSEPSEVSKTERMKFIAIKTEDGTIKGKQAFTVVNKLIERIEIHNNEKKHSHNNVKVDIYFAAVGLFDIPTEQQLIDTIERVKQKKAEKSA